MKHNHIPVHVRLSNRIARLESRLPGSEPIGGGNPYYRCSDCGRSDPEISSRGHYAGCRSSGILKEIAHYRRLYAAALLDEVTAARHALHRASVDLQRSLDAYHDSHLDAQPDAAQGAADLSRDLVQATTRLHNSLRAQQQNRP